MNAKTNEILDPNSYDKFIEHIKKDIQDSQLWAAISINKELIQIYWRIGKMLSEKALLESWGSKTIERIAKDLASSFPNVSAFSHRNLKLRRYIVLDLKVREFDPKDISQLNFYMSAVDDHLRHPGDEPTIGMIFCKTKQNFTVEYALRDFNKPIGVADYEITLVESLSKELKESLPTIEDIEAEFGQDSEETE